MKVLLGKDAEKLMKGLPVAKSFLVKKESELKKIKKFPVVMKLISPQAVHKTEINAIRTANNHKETQEIFSSLVKLSKSKRLKLSGILVQEHVKGREFIIGIKNDPTFGHVIMFGAGGIFVESLKDVTFRACPITNDDAESMIHDLKNKWLITGTRGQKPISTTQLKNLLVKVSKLPRSHKRLLELDINPVIANESGPKIVDVRAVIS